MACNTEVKEFTLQSCSEDIILRGGLTPLTAYYWLLKDRTGRICQRLVETNIDGELTIDVSVLPAGLIHRYSRLSLQIRTGDNYLQEVAMVFGDSEYTEIILRFSNIDLVDGDGSEVNVIQFSDVITPGSPTDTFPVEADFDFVLPAGKVLEYISLTNSNPMNVIVSTTPSGNELLEETISDPQPRVLMFLAESDTTIYVKGIQPGTIIKIKKS